MTLRFRPWLAAVLLLSLACIGCEFLESLTDSNSLTIREFEVSPAEIPSGTAATLRWEVDGSDSVEIDGGLGSVTAQGSREVRPSSTTRYTLTARAGTSWATASVELQVHGSVPSPTPTPTPSPTPAHCGAPASAAGNCSVSIAKPVALPGGECIELNRITANQSCPVSLSTLRSLMFEVTASTARQDLSWRRAFQSSDVLQPSSGPIASHGTTTVLTTDLVLDSSVTFEVVSSNQVLLSFTLRHN